MTYLQALAWLFEQTRSGARRHPGRAVRLLQRLGLGATPNTVRVVGTNGKGTVAAMIAAGLSASGRRTGRFLSPHVEEFRERIAVDAVSIGAESVADFVGRHRSLPHEGTEVAPSFFEWTLALALDDFARRGATWGVFEAGVGGASDATQALSGPSVRLVVLTNVAPDHLETLGPTVLDVARDKAGAGQPGVPLLTAAHGDALEVVATVAAARGAPLHVVKPPSDAETTRSANERLATAALTLLGCPERAQQAALDLAPLPGRGERFRVAGRTVILDGAHDPAAAERLVSQLPSGFTLLFGALARKQGPATLRVLAAAAEAVVLTSADQGEDPTPAPPDTPATTLTDPHAALDFALEVTQPGGTVLIAGSLYLAGRLRSRLASAVHSGRGDPSGGG